MKIFGYTISKEAFWKDKAQEHKAELEKVKYELDTAKYQIQSAHKMVKHLEEKLHHRFEHRTREEHERLMRSRMRKPKPVIMDEIESMSPEALDEMAAKLGLETKKEDKWVHFEIPKGAGKIYPKIDQHGNPAPEEDREQKEMVANFTATLRKL